jgi:DNA modification methylase
MIQIISIEKIKANPKNPRIIKDDKFDKLVKSIQEFPEMLKLRPLVIDEQGIVLGGNMRLKACQHIGLKEVPVVYANDLSEKQKEEFIIKDNVGFGEWDWDDLQNWDLEELDNWGLDIPNFDEDVLELEAKEDDFEVPQDGIETDIVLGDLFEIGEHRLLCGDSTDSDAVAKLMNGEKADMAHNDPPYGMKKEKDGVLNDNLNYDDLLEFNHEWIPLQFMHIKDNGSWYCWGIDEPLMDIYWDILKPYAKEGRATFRNLITWDKGNGQGQNSTNTRMFAIADEKCLFVMFGKQNLVQNKDQFPDEWRPLLNYFNEEKNKMGWSVQDCIKITGKTSASHYFTESQFSIPTKDHYDKLKQAAEGKAFTRDFEKINKDGNAIMDEFYRNRAYFNNTHDNMNNVWHFPRHQKDGTEGGHATPKPIPLCERAIKSSCPDNGIVLDMFLGSGSTMVASHQLKRKCYGMELDPKYCQVIVDRMKKLDPSIKIKKNGVEI